MAAEVAKRADEDTKALKGAIERYLAAEKTLVEIRAKSEAGSPLGPKELKNQEDHEEMRARQLGEALHVFWRRWS